MGGLGTQDGWVGNTHTHTYFGGGGGRGGGDVEGLHEVGGEGSPALMGVLLLESASLVVSLRELGHSSMQCLHACI